MPMADNNSKFKRTNLFLLRIWCDDTDEIKSKHEHGCEDTDQASPLTWHGIVHRTVSGEAHRFETKGDLIEVLEAMLRKDNLKLAKSRGKSAPKANLLESADNQTTVTEANS